MLLSCCANKFQDRVTCARSSLQAIRKKYSQERFKRVARASVLFQCILHASHVADVEGQTLFRVQLILKKFK